MVSFDPSARHMATPTKSGCLAWRREICRGPNRARRCQPVGAYTGRAGAATALRGSTQGVVVGHTAAVDCFQTPSAMAPRRDTRAEVKPSAGTGGAAHLRFASRGFGVGSAGNRRADPVALRLSPDHETGAGRDCRRWPSVHRADDLAAVYALQVDARDAEVRMSELPLDDDERDALVRHLDGVGVPQLVWGEPAPDARAAAADATVCARPMVPNVVRRSVRGYASMRRSDPWISTQGSSWSHAQRSIPTSRRLPPFPRRINTAPRVRSRSLSWSESASLIRSPARHSSTISASGDRRRGHRSPHHSDDLFDRRRIGRVLLTLVSRRTASVVAGHGRG